MPSHEHWHNHPHNHDRGNLNITGYFGLDDAAAGLYGGAFVNGGWGYGTGATGSETGCIMNFDACRCPEWVNGRTGVDYTAAGGWQGGNQPHNNMQPYRSAICWHRTE